MLYKQTFVVAGTGCFPLDMLRYDRCSPYEPKDVDTIEVALKWNSPNEIREIRLVRFVTNKKYLPTKDRWDSFGWLVLSIQTEKML